MPMPEQQMQDRYALCLIAAHTTDEVARKVALKQLNMTLEEARQEIGPSCCGERIHAFWEARNRAS